MGYIYADTSVWNCLCDQGVDPDLVLLQLKGRNFAFAIGFNVLYEIAKQFFSGTEAAKVRGRQLFAYTKRYLALRVPIVKENWALLVEEALDVTGEKRFESCFRNDDDYRITIQEIDKLCRDEIPIEVTRFFESRKSEARSSRTVIKDNLGARPDLRAILASVSEEDLSNFLKTEVIGPAGQFLLLGHLRREFPQNLPYELAGVAKLLLQSPRYRVSRTMTRADLYLNWRCVNRGSIRGDLPDDTFHVVSASYSNVFVTTEADQANIAKHAIEDVQAIVLSQGQRVLDRLAVELDPKFGASSGK